MSWTFPRFFVNGYLIFPQDQTSIFEKLSSYMKEELNNLLNYFEEEKEREKLIKEYGEDYVLDNPEFWTFDRVSEYPDAEIHATTLIDELDDNRFKISFEGEYVWLGQFMEDDLRILSKVPGVEAVLSVRPVDSENTKKFKLKDGKLEVKEV